jgi:hypothetical protein
VHGQTGLLLPELWSEAAGMAAGERRGGVHCSSAISGHGRRPGKEPSIVWSLN